MPWTGDEQKTERRPACISHSFCLFKTFLTFRRVPMDLCGSFTVRLCRLSALTPFSYLLAARLPAPRH